MSVGLFVRRLKDVTPAQASRCDNVIVAVQSNRAPAYNRDLSWWDSVTCEKMGFLWLPLPGVWKESEVREAIRFLGSVGAIAVVVNAEPRGRKHKPHRWEDTAHAEAERYMRVVRDEADKQDIAVGFTSWALTHGRKRFPWAAFFEASDFSITQPYEVHGRAGRGYVEECIASYVQWGHARENVWVGRGAHELDDSDTDAWREPVEIAEHRESTPPGASETWWLPRGRIRPKVLDAILADRDPATIETPPAPAPLCHCCGQPLPC